MVTKLGPLCKVNLLKDKGDTLVVCLKRLASAVQLRPWPPCFQRVMPEARTMLLAIRPPVDKNSRLFFMTYLLEAFSCEGGVHRFDQRRLDRSGRESD